MEIDCYGSGFVETPIHSLVACSYDAPKLFVDLEDVSQPSAARMKYSISPVASAIRVTFKIRFPHPIRFGEALSAFPFVSSITSALHSTLLYALSFHRQTIGRRTSA